MANGVGTHLLRIRVRNSLRDQLQALADEMSDATQSSVTISDIVRSACTAFLASRSSAKKLGMLLAAAELEAAILEDLNAEREEEWDELYGTPDEDEQPEEGLFLFIPLVG